MSLDFQAIPERLIPPERAAALFAPPAIPPFMDFHGANRRHRLSFFSSQKFGERPVRLSLIPVGDRSNVQCQTIGMTMFDRGSQRLLEGDRVFQMKPITVCPPKESRLSIDTRNPEVGV